MQSNLTSILTASSQLEDDHADTQQRAKHVSILIWAELSATRWRVQHLCSRMQRLRRRFRLVCFRRRWVLNERVAQWGDVFDDPKKPACLRGRVLLLSFTEITLCVRARFSHKAKVKSKTHAAVLNCYIPSWILKLSNTPCFRMTRWAVNADIFLLSPQRTPSTWQRHQISKNRLLLSSISLLHPSLWCAESEHWNTCGKQIYITVLRFKPLCSSIITLRLTFHRI